MLFQVYTEIKPAVKHRPPKLLASDKDGAQTLKRMRSNSMLQLDHIIRFGSFHRSLKRIRTNTKFKKKNEKKRRKKDWKSQEPRIGPDAIASKLISCSLIVVKKITLFECHCPNFAPSIPSAGSKKGTRVEDSIVEWIFISSTRVVFLFFDDKWHSS